MKSFLLIIAFIFLISNVFAQEIQSSIQQTKPGIFFSEDLAEELLTNMRRRYATKDTKTLLLRKKELEKQLRQVSLPILTRKRLELECSVIDENLTQR